MANPIFTGTEDIYAFVSSLENYLRTKHAKDIWLYSRGSQIGSLLIKNIGNDKIYILKSSDSRNAIGGSRIEKFINSVSKFKGKNIDNYVYIGFNFKENSFRLSKVNKKVSLLLLNYHQKSIVLHGSMNLDLNILNHFVEFADYIGFSISYDFEGLLKHQGFNGKQLSARPMQETLAQKQTAPVSVVQVQSRAVTPKVFFSYSWDNESHKLWVLKLASDLIKSGIEVLIDEWDLDNCNNDLHIFMESGIRDSDKVIMICTPKYAEKTNSRLGGVGVENTIITGEFYEKEKNNKYITLSKNYVSSLNECLPSYLKSKYSIDFNSENDYKEKLDELIRRILSIPKFKRPQLGQIPNLESSEL